MSRAWGRFHLSTLLVVSFAAGIALYANLRPWAREIQRNNGLFTASEIHYGWPFSYEVETVVVPQLDGSFLTTFGPVTLRSPGRALANAASIAILLALLAGLLERRGRARHARQPAPDHL